MNRQHVEEVERITQQLDMNRQQWEESQQTSQQKIQQQIEAVQQKLQQLDQDSRQQIQDIRQQTQQQIGKVIIDVQGLNEQTKHSQQQSLQQMLGIGRVKQEQDRLSPELRRQEAQQAFNQLVNAQYLVQAVLAKPSHKSTAPRLFIILPGPASRQGGLLSLQFRLYFLCECGSHTMTKDCNTQHEVHLADHPGYDLNDQDEFITKYGSYLLSMMYMVKNGTKKRGLVVPPLLGFNHTIGEGEGIGQLVDDTITHLKGVTGYGDGDSTAHQSSDTMRLPKLKSHLKIKDGEVLTGGLVQMRIQKAYHPWICTDHFRECYESTLQQLRHNINTSGGVWHGNEVKVKVTSETTAKQFYEDLGKLFKIQSVENWRSITEMEFKPDSYQPASGSTTDAPGLDDLDSLSLDFGRFAMSVKGVFRGEVKDVAISIRDLSAPTLDDLEFIYQCRPTALTVLETLPEKDDDRLVSILQRYLCIASLRIEGDMKRFVAIIDLVKSTRRKILQGKSKPALHIFELVHPEIEVKVRFSKGLQGVLGSLVLESCIHLKDRQSTSSLYNFIRQHGSSVTRFAAPVLFNDHLANLLDESTEKLCSRITHLDINPTSLASPGLEATSRVINRSKGLTYLRLSMENLRGKDQMAKALLLLERHKDQLTSLRLEGDKAHEWLPQIARSFPRFPQLKEFFVESYSMDWLSSADREWIASMASAPSQLQILRQLRTSLKVLGVGLHLRAQDWEALIKVIDLSTLEELYINSDYFYQDQLNVLVDFIANTSVASLPMKVLDVKGKEVKDSNTTREMFARVQGKAPQVKIQCNNWTLEAGQ
jgi:hypothetical protein